MLVKKGKCSRVETGETPVQMVRQQKEPANEDNKEEPKRKGNQDSHVLEVKLRICFMKEG